MAAAAPSPGSGERAGRPVLPREARVLAARPDNIGDVVMLGPALRALRDALPDARITLLASPAGSGAADLLPWIDDVLTERVVWQDAPPPSLPLDPSRELGLVERLRDGRFDAVLAFTSFSQSPWPLAYAAYLAGIPLRAGESKEFGGSLLTHRAPALADSVHQVDRNLHLVGSLGVPTPDPRLELVLPGEALERADELRSRSGIGPGEPHAVVAPGASASARRYPPEQAAAVANGLAAAGLPVLLVGRDHELREVGPLDPGVEPLGDRTSVPELAALVLGADVVVANNSLPMHLADALGRPVVATFSGTDFESQWRPRWTPSRVLRRDTPCSPCYRFTCPYGLPCLDIDPREVVAAALDLARAPTGAASAPAPVAGGP